LFSLVLTLYIIPVMYLIFASKERHDPEAEDAEPTKKVKKHKAPKLIENE